MGFVGALVFWLAGFGLLYVKEGIDANKIQKILIGFIWILTAWALAHPPAMFGFLN